MMVVVMMMVPMAPDHDDGPAAVVAVVMMVVVMMVLSELDVGVRRIGRTLIDDLEDLCGVRNRFQQIGVGVGLQRICRQWDCRHSLRGRQRTERRYCSQKPCYLLFHGIHSKNALPESQTQRSNQGSGTANS
jgi:hypothetical protein